METYNGCATLSSEEIERLVSQIKSRSKHSPNAQHVRKTHIDDLISSHRRSLQSLVQLHINGDSFEAFLQLLCDFDSKHSEFMQGCDLAEASTHTFAHEQGWNSLMYEVLDERVSAWLEEWLYLSLSTVLRLFRKSCRDAAFARRIEQGIERDTQPRLQKYHLLLSTCIPGEGDQGRDGSWSDSDMARQREFCKRVQASPEDACRFINSLALGCRLLAKMHVLDYTCLSVQRAVSRVVKQGVQEAASQWEDPHLDSLLRDISGVAAMLDGLLSEPQDRDSLQSSIQDYAESQLYVQFSDMRVSELFGIIIDYPDSNMAINDLRRCVVRLGNMQDVAESLRSAIQRRLLHPGATTSDILAQYISAIRCLRLLDPTNTVLEIVARPIRAYLRSREDTVPSIVQDMVAEESELFEDLASGQGLIADDGPGGANFDEDYLDKDWEPLPIEAVGVYKTAQRRDADVLSLLVSIYDSKDVFVQEFEKHLEQRLLSCTDYNTEREIRQVEMMKLRFGSHALERCEVMLKDLAESKRTDQHVAEAARRNGWEMPLHTTIVSRQFWASQAKESFAMPREMAALRDQYGGVYESLKPSRKLEWRDSLGSVSVRIELEDRTIEASVKPMQAAALYTFQATPVQTLAELAQALECTEEHALARARFWQARGVIRERSSHVFEVVESESSTSAAGDGSASNRAAAGKGDVEAEDGADEDEEDDGGGSGRPGATDARTEALRMHFNYVVGMLTNFGPLPLDRIHSMLGMFLAGENIEADELKAFLALMVREDRLEMAGGMYKLK